MLLETEANEMWMRVCTRLTDNRLYAVIIGDVMSDWGRVIDLAEWGHA